MMGHSYMEIFTNITKNLFNWIFNLFDQKIVPNIPGSNNSGGTIIKKRTQNRNLIVPSGIEFPNILDTDKYSLRNLYKGSINESTP